VRSSPEDEGEGNQYVEIFTILVVMSVKLGYTQKSIRRCGDIAFQFIYLYHPSPQVSHYRKPGSSKYTYIHQRYVANEDDDEEDDEDGMGYGKRNVHGGCAAMTTTH
jgi:hypothetical protein